MGHKVGVTICEGLEFPCWHPRQRQRQRQRQRRHQRRLSRQHSLLGTAESGGPGKNLKEPH